MVINEDHLKLGRGLSVGVERVRIGARRDGPMLLERRTTLRPAGEEGVNRARVQRRGDQGALAERTAGTAGALERVGVIDAPRNGDRAQAVGKLDQRSDQGARRR
jgi:hypothetical protein